MSDSLARLRALFPTGELLRYLCVGVFNTVFGYGTYALSLFCLNHEVPQKYLVLAAVLATIISTPLNITVAWLGYKFIVFRTRGNYLKEWLKCFGVYGVGMLPGLLCLAALTKFLQSALHHPHAAGYVAGAIVQGFTVVFSFLGHKNITFRQKRAA